LDDVIKLIRVSQLFESYGETLPYVRDGFKELWQAAQVAGRLLKVSYANCTKCFSAAAGQANMLVPT
jgi:hypothetical protein